MIILIDDIINNDNYYLIQHNDYEIMVIENMVY